MMKSWFATAPAPSILPLEIRHTRQLSTLHGQAFARPWSAIDFERMLVERNIYGDGLFFGPDQPPQGFAMSRVVIDEAEILTVTIATSQRGKGHSRRLLAGHLETLRARRILRVHLEVDEGNAPALALYRHFGFSEIGRREGYYLLANGGRATALIMAADL